MHYYKKNIGDYAKKTGRLSMLQHGAYTLLIDSCYDRERFPTLNEAIEWTWALELEEIEAVKFVLARFFVLEDGVYTQSRIQDEIAEYHAKASINKRIATERELKRKEKTTVGKRTVNESPPNQEPLTNNQEPITTNQDTPKAPKGVDSRFEDFWKAYPKKIGKDAARRAFDKRKITADMMQSVLQSVRKQCQSDAWKKDDGQFIPHPATWLNQGRWQDEIDTATAAPAEQSLMTRGGVEELALKLGESRWSQMVPFESYRRKILTLAQERGFV